MPPNAPRSPALRFSGFRPIILPGPPERILGHAGDIFPQVYCQASWNSFFASIASRVLMISAPTPLVALTISLSPFVINA